MNEPQTYRAYALSALLLAACGDTAAAPTDAGAPGVDAAAMMGDAGFDPTQTYPGEGEACEFTMFCPDQQICVDGRCERHERFTAEDLDVGVPVQIPDEQLRTSRFFTEAPFGLDGLSQGPNGNTVPGPDGPALLVWSYDLDRCQLAVVGAGPTRYVSVEGMTCTSAGLSPDGHVVIGGVRVRDGVMSYQASGLALFDPSGALIADIDYPPELRNAVGQALGQPEDDEWAPESFLHNPTSFLWDGDRFLFSASAGVPGREGRPMSSAGDIPQFPTHVFYGELTLDGTVVLVRVDDRPVQQGSYGWLVRDEAGVHSIIKNITYHDRFTPTDTRTELLSWATGERELLVDGMGGLGEAGRYGQNEENSWSLSVSSFPDSCTSSLFIDGVLDQTMGLNRSTCAVPVTVSGLGGNDRLGPVYPGNASFGWIHSQNVIAGREPTTYDTVLMRPGEEEWARLSGASVWGQFLSRFGLTFEIFALEGTTAPWVVFEGTLSRRDR